MSICAPIGVWGGTFDPVHFGHLRTALELCQQLKLGQVRFVPCQQPVHKDRVYATAEHRLAMLQLACAEQSAFYVDDRELTRNTPSFMIDTLISLRKEFPSIPLALLMGSDAFVNLPVWHRWQQLLHYAHIVVVNRPGYRLEVGSKLQSMLDKHKLDHANGLGRQLAGGILIQTTTALDISATLIRNQLRANLSPRFLLPDAVQAYIQTHQLYS